MTLKTIPSFSSQSWEENRFLKFPRVFVLAVKRRKKPDPDRVCQIIVEVQEQYFKHDAEIQQSFLTITYSLITYEPLFTGGTFYASYRRRYGDEAPSASLTSHFEGHGAVFLDLPGLEGNRIESFFMHLIVIWLKQWPNAIVHPIELLPSDSEGTNGPRRNAFYMNIGLEFEGLEDQSKRVYSKPTTVENLLVTDSWKKTLR